MQKWTVRTSSIYKCFLWLYCIVLGCRDLFQSMGLPVFIFLALLFFIPFALLVLEFVLNLKFSVGTFLFLTLIAFYLFISPVNVNGFQFFLPLLCAGLAFRYVDYKYISKAFLITQMACLTIRFYLINIGLIVEKKFGAAWKVEDGRSVYDLGYGNANSAGMIFFFLCCMIHCYWYNSKKWLSFVLILFISYFAYYYTVSRTASFSCLLLLLTYFIPKKVYVLVAKKRILLLVPLIVALPLLLVPFSSNLVFLDKFLSNRIYYMLYMLTLFQDSFSLITGVFIEENNNFPIDNVFSYLLVYGGIMAVFIFYFFYVSIVWKSQKIPFYILAVLMVIILSGIGESSWAVFGRLGSSFFWLILLNKTIILANRC
jgi:hypothetical protein